LPAFVSGLEVRPVHSKGDLRRFIKLPFRLYASEPNWVPPLIFERKQFLDRGKNPWFKHAKAEYFMAWRGDRVVGRITAQVDANYQAFHEDRCGQFGFFECEDDQEAATALVTAATDWLRAEGCTEFFGPCDFTTNDECGVLIEGHERTPLILSPWTHPYYTRLLEGAGLSKQMDLLMWELHISDREKVHPAIWEMAARVESEHGVHTRFIRLKDFKAEVQRFLEVYNGAWERNWGFVPVTDQEEVQHYAKTLRPVLSKDWMYFAEKDGETVGAALTLPDFNQVLMRMNGRLLPFGWLKALWYRRKIDRVRVFALGVKRGWQHTGIAAKFYEMHFDAAERTAQKGGEMGWILETNEPMNRAMEGMGGRVVRRFRLYGAKLSQDGTASVES
jgi:GNAT superfamily N-acetyltransferase